MSMGYRGMTESELAWKENREKVELQGRQILRRVMDQALLALDVKFRESLKRGEVMQLDYDKKELRSLLREQTLKSLETGGEAGES